MKFSSVEEDELAIFLLPMPVSLPGGEVGVSALFHTISFSFEAVRDEYLRRMQRLHKGRPSCPFSTRYKLPHGLKRTIYIERERLARCTSRTCGARIGSPQLEFIVA